MKKINLKDIEHKLLKSDKVIVDCDNYIPSNGTSKKVNLKDIHNLLRSRKKLFIHHLMFLLKHIIQQKK